MNNNLIYKQAIDDEKGDKENKNNSVKLKNKSVLDIN